MNSHGLAGKFSWLLSAHGIRELLQAAFFIYAARLSNTFFGSLSFAFALGQILLLVAQFGMDQHLVVRLGKKDADAGRAVAEVTVIKTILFALAWLCVIGVVCSLEESKESKLVVLIIATGIGLEALANSFFVVSRIHGRQDTESKVRSAGAIAGLGYGLTALFVGLAPILIALYKVIETVVCTAGSMFFAIKRQGVSVTRPRFSDALQTWRASLVFALISISGILYNKLNIFFLEHAAGLDAVAQYSATWNLVEGITVLITGLLLARIVFPIFSKLKEDNMDEMVRLARSSARWLILLAMPIVFVLYIEADRIIPLVYGEKYSAAVWMQKYLAITVLFSFLHNLAAYMMMSAAKERILLVTYLLGLVLNLVLCASLIPEDPLVGSVTAIVLTKAVMFLMTVGYCCVRFRILPLWDVFWVTIATVIGVALYLATGEHLPREAQELLCIVPVAGMALYWRRRSISE